MPASLKRRPVAVIVSSILSMASSLSRKCKISSARMCESRSLIRLRGMASLTLRICLTGKWIPNHLLEPTGINNAMTQQIQGSSRYLTRLAS